MKEIEQKKPSRSDNFIPDYDYLFEQDGIEKKKRNKGFFTKILMINKWPIALSLIIYLFQMLPVWVTPILTADIINTVVNTIQTGYGITQVGS